MSMVDNSAFPTPTRTRQDGEVLEWSNGMSLRDYFAAKALQGYYAWEHCSHRCDPDEVATYCYKTADAFLRAREKP